MKKRVINKERITKKGKMILASFVIGTTILNGVGVYAGNDLSTSVSYYTKDSSVAYILNNIYDIYGHSSAHDLMVQTHSEKPWQDTPQSSVISDQAIKDYYSKVFVVDE